MAERLGHQFAEPALFERALTHRSWCAEHAGDLSNERLEFLGDAVLGMVAAEHLFHARPELSEGWLSRARSSLVRSSTLAEVAEQLGIGGVLRLGKGEALSGGRTKPSLLADALEAVIGAVYLDAGLDAARSLVVRLLDGRIAQLPVADDAAASPAVHDYKSRLQEFVARTLASVPEYRSEESGPEHEKEFRTVVLIDGAPRGTGTGRNKKQAEQAAASMALHDLAGVLPDAASTEPGAVGANETR